MLFKEWFWNSKIYSYVQTAEEAMTPIESTFSLDVNSKLDWWVSLLVELFTFVK